VGVLVAGAGLGGWVLPAAACRATEEERYASAHLILPACSFVCVFCLGDSSYSGVRGSRSI
jgi:hypothetical protein